MNDTATAPWSNPPQRKKPLKKKRAERTARKAEHWGGRLEQARQEGPEEHAAVTFDRLRSELNKLPESYRDAAYEAVVQDLERLREKHAQ